MNASEIRWDDELAFEILQRHATEDLHAGIYDSYLTSVRGLLTALRDERPLVPVYAARPGTGELIGRPNLSLLELYRVQPNTGLVCLGSMAVVAYVDPPTATAFQPTRSFTDAQVYHLIEHHEELMESGLVPRVPSE